MVDFSKKAKENCLLFKVDFKKAYDKVSWDYLTFVMKKMGFGECWKYLMSATVFMS